MTPKLPPGYALKRVDGEEWHKEINALHKEGFDRDYKKEWMPESEWWLVFDPADDPVAMAGLQVAVAAPEGYLIRSAVTPRARGYGLQRYLIRTRERHARRLGLETLITDTHSNVHSANNLIREGFTLYRPAAPWTDNDRALYWRKELH